MAELWQKIPEKYRNSVEFSLKRTSTLGRRMYSRFQELFGYKKQEKEPGPEFEIKINQWTVRVWKDRYEIVNLDEDGETRSFYLLKSGKYGQPLIEAEPDRAFEAPKEVIYVNAKGEKVDPPKEKISGIICQEEDGSVAHRFSLSNKKAPKFKPTEDGIEIEVAQGEGENTTIERWYLTVLFDKDGNRIQNHDGYYGRVKPSVVKILELQDLNFVKLAGE
ncbi:MAG: hypothetical protein COU63_04800 [Candidatus Pacebacteria bacterium CG10_big_fil_rev_8_21_14_0_10_36_11]|nr:hypothetical protein [Candidatus Pacearchaeota archaeon]OIP73977.1 MAG: hypothetical protein AUK08_01815 [Candidatus Pacebacteria bacterium CG2_30_36_39]PIR64385.1 MAG: hypothetical protein COU63_04800 [Candidatus Pacebacteria bacterium CG10_big_fil_rev_8_21_14_0_10_36_11]